ncbi:MAG: amidohydrolase family protein [Gemmatimonadetes bacterium]|nr:amidohydrolase family protein [Gemmatimonadota bacterium]
MIWRQPSAMLVSALACLIQPLAARQATDSTTGDSAHTTERALPLEPTRTVAVATDEGSWISLDVSPDGQTIVFDLLGDLYTIPFGGGVATPLTSGMPFDGQPRFSPDGTKVLFISDRDGAENLWTITLDKSDTAQITTGKRHRYHGADWTPDGRYILGSKAVAAFGTAKLWMWHVDGGTGVELIGEPKDLKIMGAAVEPAGRYVWYAQATGPWQYNAILPRYQLAVYDRETGQRYTRSARGGSAFRPTLSPDGRWLVYGTRFEAQTGLRIRDLPTGEERWLAYPVQRDDQESFASRDVLPGMSFTPDSREVVVSYDGGIWRVPVNGDDPTKVLFAVSVHLDVGPNLDFTYPIDDAPEFTVRQIRDAVPSPNGGRLAFVAMDDLYVMDYPDGTPRRLTESDMVEAQPAWSPDGEWIAYATWSTEDGGHLHRVRANGRGGPDRLTSMSGIYQQPVWSHDGERIVAIRGPAQNYRDAIGPFAPGAAADIVWIPARGGDAQFIAPTEGRSRPHFHDAADNPDRVYLYHPSNGLVSIRFDGTDEKRHLRVRGPAAAGATEPRPADLVMAAPVGDKALALLDNEVYVVTIPWVGGETPTVSVANVENAAFPTKKLTAIGGQFPTWSADGRRVHWSIGNAHVVYDLDAAAARDDSLKSFRRSQGDEPSPDEDTEEGPPGYEPEEHRVTIMVRRDTPLGTVALRGARVITMRGDEVIENADIVVRNNRIVAVGRRGQVTIPDGADVIDVSGKTIVPGFIDTHAHIRPAWGIHKQQPWAYLTNLAYGVTTTRDPQTSSTDVLSYQDMVDAGTIMGPRVYSTGPGVFGGYQGAQIRDQAHARDIMKRYSEYYDTKTIKMYMAGNRQQRQWIIIAAREQHIKPTTEGGLDLKYDLTMMIDGYPGQEHALPVTPLYRDVIELTAQTQILYTPTLIVSFGGPFGENYFYTRENPHDDMKLRYFTPHSEIDQKTRRRGTGTGPGPGGWFMEEEHIFPHHARTLKDIVEAGGKVGVGSHGQLQGLGYHWEIRMMQSGGMTEHDALRAATIFGAEGLGFGGDLGSVETGKLADLVVLDANPLDDIRNTNTVSMVMKNGRLYEGDTLNEVWPRQVPLTIPDHWDERPATNAGIRR